MIWRAILRLVLYVMAIKARLTRRALPAPETGQRDSEAAAEVVRVTEISEHGNADFMEIVKFAMRGTGPSAYEVVCRKGDFKPGDLAAYFSVDCVVPVKGPFEFLGKRLDGAGKSHYRLRAARIRGRYSQGLLLPTDWWGPKDLGDQLWSDDITYHRAPEPGEPVVLQSNKPRPQPIPVYGVTSGKKEPGLFDDVPLVFVTEKIHGTNFRFGWVRRRVLGIPIGWKFVVGSHRVIKSGDGETSWYGEDVWSEFASRNNLAGRTAAYPGRVFYGELYGHTYSGKPIQDMAYGRLPGDGPGLVIFDVLGPSGWASPIECRALCGALGLPSVPEISRGNSSFEDLAEGPSLMPGAPRGHIREGVVVESVGVEPRRKVKYVSQAYHLRKEAP